MIFTTTSYNAPEILNRTYESFHQNLLGIDWDASRLIINVDPIPDSVSMDECLVVARRWFPEVNINLSTTPSFPKALYWCWSQVDEEWWFNLEYDWLLMEPVHIDKLMDKLKLRASKCCYNLRAYLHIGHSANLMPGLWHRNSYVEKFLKNYRFDRNPEDQIISKKVPGMMHYPAKSIIIKDIGRKYLETTKWKRDPSAAGFVEPILR